jgi:putative toxin-antitoxin system antitoxin component (TIGR02293 family)
MTASASAQVAIEPEQAPSAPLPETNPAVTKLAQFQPDWREVEHGLPISILEEFSVYSGFALKDLLEVVIPARTLKHRRQRNEPLNMDESDRLARVARIHGLAVKVYGDHDGARKWLSGPKRRFDGKTALSMLRTETGEIAVQDFLIQIDEGYFA